MPQLRPIKTFTLRNWLRLMGGLFLGMLVACDSGLPASGPKQPLHAARNLILISVDTLRADHLGIYGSTRGLSPNLDALAKESVIFDSAYAPAPFTLASVGSLLTGRYPKEIGISWNQSVLAPGIPTLAQLLGRQGFATHAVVSNFVLRSKKSGIEAGFDVYDDRFLDMEASRKIPERVAADTTQAALESLEVLSEGDQRFFLWVHYQDPHGPYTPGEEVRARYLNSGRASEDSESTLPPSLDGRGFGAIPKYQFLPDHYDPEFYRAGYEGEVQVMDAAVGELIDAIRSRGLLEDSLVIVTADHGESLGEDGYWFGHGEFLSDAVIRVPLFFHLPGPPAQHESIRRRDTASLVDLLPTSLALLGISETLRTSGRELFHPTLGKSPTPILLASLGEATRPRFGLIEAGFKYRVAPPVSDPSKLREGDGSREQRLFAQEDESRLLNASRPDLLKRISRRLFDLYRRLARPTAAPRAQSLSPEERQQLEALGYLGSE